MRTLQAFEAVSRHLSISKAAEELGVTQSAVSHQLRQLSEAVGEKLLARKGRNIELTAVGRRLATRLQSAFTQIDRSVSEVIGTDREVVRLAVCSSFAPGWLIGRLKGFFDSHPKVDLQLHMYAKDPALTDEVADAFVTTFPTEKGFWAMKLLPERLIPVAPAALAMGHSNRLPLITTTLDPARLGGDWAAYCETAGLVLVELRSGPWLQVTHYVLALEMARAGLGVALVPDFLAASDLSRGNLRQPWPQALPTHEDYYMCVKASRRQEPPLRALAAWFRRHAVAQRDTPGQA
jgi:LysR family transcriptional regulator, glycine cleavage system transcriptional activator